MKVALAMLLTIISSSAALGSESTIQLQLLNKISGKKRNIAVPLGSAYLVDELKIVPRGCKPAPGLFADVKSVIVTLDVFIEQEEGEAVVLFQGDVNSSPHYPHQPLEHPIYDILVKDCQVASPSIS